MRSQRLCTLSERPSIRIIHERIRTASGTGSIIRLIIKVEGFQFRKSKSRRILRG